MFDIGWSELLILGIVAVLVVGPRDLPRLMRVVGQYVSWVRSMANDFKQHVKEAVDQADLDDVRSAVDDLNRNNPLQDVKNSIRNAGQDIEKSIDKAGEKSDEEAGSGEPEEAWHGLDLDKSSSGEEAADAPAPSKEAEPTAASDQSAEAEPKIAGKAEG